MIAIICPSCGGTVHMEGEMISGFCVHCGKEIENEQKSGVPIEDGDSDLVKYLKQTKGSLIKHDWDTAAGLVDSILKMDAECQDAWFMKALIDKRSGASGDGIEKAESGGMKNHNVFSKEDIAKYWGELTLKITYEKSKRTTVNVDTLLTIDGKETVAVKRGQTVFVGLNPGAHDIAAQFIVSKGLTAGDKMSFIASKDHEFAVKTTSSGMMMTYIEPKIVQIS